MILAALIASRIHPLKSSTLNGSPCSVGRMQTCLRVIAASAARSDSAFSTNTAMPVLRRVYLGFVAVCGPASLTRTS